MISEVIYDLADKLEENSDFIGLGLDKRIIGALNSSNNFLSISLENNQSVKFNISNDIMYLYEISAKGFGKNLMLQIINKALNDGLRFIKIEAKPLDLDENSESYNTILKYLFSFYSSFGFKRDGNSNYFTLDLDNNEIMKVLSNKFSYYLNSKKWIVL